MTEDNQKAIIALLQEIRDNQKIALERQARLLELSEENFARASGQLTKARQLTDTAERIQLRAIRILKWLPALVVLLVVLIVIFSVLKQLPHH